MYSNTTHTVIIPTAGTGSRMGNYTKNLNKALLPYKNKPVLGHIIEQFPIDTEFIILVGHLSKQVKDFCNVAYQNRNIQFVEIDDWTSEKSGTGYSLLQCKNVVKNSFWYVTCDTYFDQPVIDKIINNDCYFVKEVPENISQLYTMFKVGNDSTIQDITFKQKQPNTWAAWTGLMYIYNWEQFFIDLSEHNGTEFIPIIKRGSHTIPLNTWLDFGSSEQYTTALSKSQKFDFSKNDEVTYICNDRVVKWWLDNSIAEKKYDKTLINSKVFPNNCTYSGNFLAHDFYHGQTLYNLNNPAFFKDYLNWLKNNVWQPVEIDLRNACIDFYKTKTLYRVDKFLKKYQHLPKINYIDGIEVKDYQYYLDRIDWDYLCTTYAAGFTHGDLHFDNTIIGDNLNFKIIDWRHEFADVVGYGDIYYDFAKLKCGFIISYADIKEHKFNIDINEDNVTLGVPHIEHYDIYIRRLKEFIIKEGYDYKKVQMLIPIIFWNMSPLHTAPFDLFLWYLGIKLFAELDNGQSNFIKYQFEFI